MLFLPALLLAVTAILAAVLWRRARPLPPRIRSAPVRLTRQDGQKQPSAVKTGAPQGIRPTQNRELRRNPSSQLGDKIAVQIGGVARFDL